MFSFKNVHYVSLSTVCKDLDWDENMILDNLTGRFTYGDSRHTLISSDDFLDCLSWLTEENKSDFLSNIPPNYYIDLES